MTINDFDTTSWNSTVNDQTLVLHTVYIRHYDSSKKSECTMIVDSTIVPLLPKSAVSLHPAPPDIFKIASAGNKGAGMFATCDIPAGALIIVEHPVIITPALVSLPRDSGVYEALFRQLLPSARQELLTMVNSRSTEECGSEEEGISRTNGTGIDLPVPISLADNPEAMEYGAVFLKINRSNHRYGIHFRMLLHSEFCDYEIETQLWPKCSTEVGYFLLFSVSLCTPSYSRRRRNHYDLYRCYCVP